MGKSDKALHLKDLLSDLARKYAKHGPAVKATWRSFDRVQRTKCIKVGTRDGEILRHPLDASLGNVCKIMPEWNLRDIADPNSDSLLDMLRRRATSSVFGQYCGNSVSGAQGDASFILEIVERQDLRSANSYGDSYMELVDENHCGRPFTITAGSYDEVMRRLEPAVRNGLLVLRATGELIMLRQMCLLQSFNIIIDGIL